MCQKWKRIVPSTRSTTYFTGGITCRPQSCYLKCSLPPAKTQWQVSIRVSYAMINCGCHKTIAQIYLAAFQILTVNMHEHTLKFYELINLNLPIYWLWLESFNEPPYIFYVEHPNLAKNPQDHQPTFSPTSLTAKIFAPQVFTSES